MNAVDIPDFGAYDIDHLVCDFNGTLAVDGELLPGVEDALNELTRSLQVHVVTADTFGTAERALEKIDCRIDGVQPEHTWVTHRRQRVQVGNEVIRFMFPLQIDVLTNRSEEVAPMKSTGRLNTG